MLFTFMSNTYFFFDIVNIAMYTLLIRYRFYNVNIAEYFFAVNIVDIVDIATCDGAIVKFNWGDKINGLGRNSVLLYVYHSAGYKQCK